MEKRQYRYFDLIMALFVTVLLLSNLLSSAKIVDLQASIGPIPLIFDAGTLVFPISYIFGDILTEVYGFRRSRRVIWAGFGAMVLMAFFVWLAGVLPGEPTWMADANFGPDVVPGQTAFDTILGGISGLAVASLAAYFAGEFSNSYVLARMKIATRGRWVWLRTIGSTLVGQIVDTVSFIGIATLLGVFNSDQFLGLVVTNYILKVGIEVVLTPITLQIISTLKQAEDEDVYDYNTDFNPFRLNL
jgi:uncharacterized integral membrane protein (TIGR00697 family)